MLLLPAARPSLGTIVTLAVVAAHALATRAGSMDSKRFWERVPPSTRPRRRERGRAASCSPVRLKFFHRREGSRGTVLGVRCLLSATESARDVRLGWKVSPWR